MKPILFIFSGLPGSGKSTLAKQLAPLYHAAYLRIDTIEQGLRELCLCDVQGEGYRLAYRITADNLKAGNNVIADSCNPWQLTRSEWEDIARQNNAYYINIEIVCSDIIEHKHRIETRKSEVNGLKLPTWDEIQKQEYHPWQEKIIRIDTAGKTMTESFDELMDKIKAVNV